MLEIAFFFQELGTEEDAPPAVVGDIILQGNDADTQYFITVVLMLSDTFIQKTA